MNKKELINDIIENDTLITKDIMKKLDFKYEISFGDEFILISPIKYKYINKMLGHECSKGPSMACSVIILPNDEGVFINKSRYLMILEKIRGKLNTLENTYKVMRDY